MDKAVQDPLIRSFERHLRAENRSERTIATYLIGLRQADTFLRTRGTTLEAATRADLEAFLADVLSRRTASTAATYDEMAGLKLADVDLEHDVLLVLGGEALDRYLRARSRHKAAELPWLWLGKQGRLTEWGLVLMLRRRGAQAGMPGLHPHQFRHTFAHQWRVGPRPT